MSKTSHQYYLRNKERIKEYCRIYYLSHPEKKDRNKKWKLIHPEKVKEYNKKHYKNFTKNHPKEVKERNEKRKKNGYFKKYYEKNRDKINKLNREWRIKNPVKWRMANKVNIHRRRTLGKIDVEAWLKKIDLFNYTCQICFKKEPKIKLTIDHIIPVSKGGTNEIENLQPLCISCNHNKFNHLG